MKALDLQKLNKPPNILFYGPAGAGKTALVSQAAGGYLFDCDDGMRTALTLQDKFTPLRQAIEFDTYVDTDPTKPSAYLAVLQMRSELANGKCPYDAVVIDSLTGLCRSIQLHVMGCSGNSFAIPKVQHFGQMVNELESILSIVRAFKVLTLLTAHEMAVETDGGSILIRIMSVTKPHGMNKLPWLFDEVLYANCRPKGRGEYAYTVTGRESSSILARTRSGLKEDFVHNDVGLAGILERVGYKYKPNVATNT